VLAVPFPPSLRNRVPVSPICYYFDNTRYSLNFCRVWLQHKLIKARKVGEFFSFLKNFCSVALVLATVSLCSVT